MEYGLQCTSKQKNSLRCRTGSKSRNSTSRTVRAQKRLSVYSLLQAVQLHKDSLLLLWMLFKKEGTSFSKQIISHLTRWRIFLMFSFVSFQNTLRYEVWDRKTHHAYDLGYSLRIENSQGRLLTALRTCWGTENGIAVLVEWFKKTQTRTIRASKPPIFVGKFKSTENVPCPLLWYEMGRARNYTLKGRLCLRNENSKTKKGCNKYSAEQNRTA